MVSVQSRSVFTPLPNQLFLIFSQPEGKTWSEACRKPREADLCESHPYELLQACVDMAEKITYNRDGYKFTFRYIITGDGIKCEELGIMGVKSHITRPMYQCPNMRIQNERETIRLPIFYISQSCQGDKLYAFRRTDEYKRVKVMGEWTRFEVKHSASGSPMPPTGVWLQYKCDTHLDHTSPARVLNYKGGK